MRRYTHLLLLATFLLLGSTLCRAQLVSENADSYMKLVRLFNLVETAYVDTVNVPKLTEKAIIEVLKNLDPHSTYVSKEEFAAANEPLEGSFDGIGVEFSILNDTLLIVAPIAGGPSERVGIIVGDRIIAVDGKGIAGVGMKTQDITKLLRGKRDTKVQLRIVRRSSPQPLDFVVTRDRIPINSIDAAYEVRPGVAYIKLSRFAVTSMDEIFKAFAKFSKLPDALILDLRGNSGGALPTAASLADQFLEGGRLIFYTEGLHQPKRTAQATSLGLFKTGKLIVLINEGSASASEIVAGAVQDWDRGVLIGRRTFGKGLVQQQLPLGDGSYVRLTIARYHTPTGRVIQSPYESGNSDKYYEDYVKRLKGSELYNADSAMNIPSELKYKTLVKKRMVYGGGGIMPDIFVPYDTTSYSPYYGKLSRMGIINRFVLSYMDTNRASLLERYGNFEHFDHEYVVTDEMMNDLVAFGEKEKVERDEKGLETSRKDIQVYLKALIARDLWSTTEYFRIVNANGDNDFAKAIEVLDSWDSYMKKLKL